MKKIICTVVLSVPLFLTSFPSFSVSISALYNPESRTDGPSSAVYNNNLPKAGTNYAYWHHWHRGY